MTSDKKSYLIGIIEKNPGLNFRDLMRFTGMKNGVLNYHLNKLEKIGSILVIREPRKSRFYPPNLSLEESKIIKSLRRSTPKSIIESLLIYESLEFREIVDYSKKSPSTVSLYLSQLVSDGIVKTKLSDRIKLYCLSDKKSIDRLIDDYHPEIMDRPVSGFEDIINSL